MKALAEAPREAPESFAALAACVHPGWHDDILRLAKATEHLEHTFKILMGPTDQYGGIITCVRAVVADLVAWLDEYGDADPDLEPSLGWPMGLAPLVFTGGNDDREQDDCDDENGADDEPSLGSHEVREGGVISYLHRPICADGEMYLDGEEQCEDEGVTCV